MGTPTDLPRNPDSPPSRHWLWLIALSAFVIACVAITPWAVCAWKGQGSTAESLAAFAEQFGLPAAAFSGLAFAALIVTLRMQMEELSLQRQELRNTQEVMKQQTEEFRLQVSAMQSQTFNSTFFHMLRNIEDLRQNVTRNIRTGMSSNQASRTMQGREAIARTWDNLKEVLSGVRTTPHGLPVGCVQDLASSEFRNAIVARFEEEYKAHLSDSIGHLYRSIYVLLKLVTDTDGIDTKTYVRIIRSQMSQSELALLFYNCISQYGSPKMLALVEKHGFFQNLSPSSLVDPSHCAWIKSPYSDK